jgi:hypothetical protein
MNGIVMYLHSAWTPLGATIQSVTLQALYHRAKRSRLGRGHFSAPSPVDCDVQPRRSESLGRTAADGGESISLSGTGKSTTLEALRTEPTLGGFRFRDLDDDGVPSRVDNDWRVERANSLLANAHRHSDNTYSCGVRSDNGMASRCRLDAALQLIRHSALQATRGSVG